MRIFPLSDIHTEFHPDGGKEFLRGVSTRKDEVDVLVVAGDVGTIHRNRAGKHNLSAMLEMLCGTFKHVVMVCGNHERYSTESLVVIPSLLTDFAAKHPNFHWLNRTSVEIDGQTFIGTTLWFKDDPLAFHARQDMNDFRVIPNFVPWVFEENAKDVKFLRQNMKPGVVVVTHHLPSRNSTDPRYANSSLNPFFFTEMGNDIHRCKPVLWIHGHTHAHNDYYLGDTRVVCNPFGYIQSGETQDFDWNFAIDLPGGNLLR